MGNFGKSVDMKTDMYSLVLYKKYSLQSYAPYLATVSCHDKQVFHVQYWYI